MARFPRRTVPSRYGIRTTKPRESPGKRVSAQGGLPSGYAVVAGVDWPPSAGSGTEPPNRVLHAARSGVNVRRDFDLPKEWDQPGGVSSPDLAV